MKHALLLAILVPLLLLVGGQRLHATNKPSGVHAMVGDIAQQIEPKKEITASVGRSSENEIVTLFVTFPEDKPRIRVAFYSIIGKLIETSGVSTVTKGEYTFTFRTTGLPNGPYLVVLEAGDQRITKKVLISR
ncbi:MAG: T9SS type A sorting domain-containing protein [Armatimonadetes bacterium]|nr:T9SS type A sorting domain-containing protein [Armatimonadota bacterium]